LLLYDRRFEENHVSRAKAEHLNYQVLELDGVRYAILREAALRSLCRRARVEPAGLTGDASVGGRGADEVELDGPALARRLVMRRKRAGLGQAELARRAGIRVETLNRLERGKTTPDFSTIRRLVVAMNQADAELQLSPAAGQT
jgi:DNA-binding XRE family transcriptional regulator